MSKKHFSWLLGLTVVAAVIAALLPSETRHDSGFEKAGLLPGLESRVNDIDWLQISADDRTVATITRNGEQWVVEEAAGYRADWPKLQLLLSALAGAEVVELKTENPDYYERLGVQESAVRITFNESTGLQAVISGNTAQGREGQYVRLAGSPQSVLIDRELDIAATTLDWLEREIIDISDSEVVEMAITHADGEGVLAKKVSADDENFELQGIPEGFELKSDWSINSLAGGLSSLQMNDVMAATEIDWTGATRFRELTADGVNIEAQLVTVAAQEESGEAQHWLSLKASVYTTGLGNGIAENTAQDSGETRERADKINGRTGGWAYLIPENKYDSMVKRMEDLVQKVETSE